MLCCRSISQHQVLTTLRRSARDVASTTRNLWCTVTWRWGRCERWWWNRVACRELLYHFNGSKRALRRSDKSDSSNKLSRDRTGVPTKSFTAPRDHFPRSLHSCKRKLRPNNRYDTTVDMTSTIDQGSFPSTTHTRLRVALHCTQKTHWMGEVI